MSSVIVIVDGWAAERVTLSVTVMVEVIIDTEVSVEIDVYVVASAQVDGVIVIVVPGHEEGELVLLADVLVEVVVAPAKQVQALLNFELDAEHGDRKLGKDEAAVATLVV